MEQPAPPRALRLERAVRPRRRIFRWLRWAASSVWLATKLLGGPPAADCRIVSLTASAKLAAEVCERDYLRTGDPWTGIRLADAQRRTGNLAVADALAHGLLVTAARGDALWLIGLIAAADDRLDTARRALDNARTLELAAHRGVEAARDSLALTRLAARAEPRSPGH